MTANITSQPRGEIIRVEGRAGVRLVCRNPDGSFSIRRTSGPTRGDPVCYARDEALEWARELVDAKGLPLFPDQPSPNERVDALARALPRPAPAPAAKRGSGR